MNKEFPILNYPGSKRTLLNFINDKIRKELPREKAILDLYAGSGSVSYYFKDNFKIYANDSEAYSFVLLQALLKFKQKIMDEQSLIKKIEYYFKINEKKLNAKYSILIEQEYHALLNQDYTFLLDVYEKFENVWKLELNSIEYFDSFEYMKKASYYQLFSSYYTGTYFGLFQSIEIDSLKYSIDVLEIDTVVKDMLHSCLFFAMKEAVFSKDGHMAQPLNPQKNKEFLFKKRNVSIYEKFLHKLKLFYSNHFNDQDNNNKVFNYNLDDILVNKSLPFDEIGFIYADPPYTDMQYSRYFHLLNTLVNYDYPNFSSYRGGLSKGLYTENRFQSPLSQKSKAISYHKAFFDLCKEKEIGFAFSFAYPKDVENQKTNRYVLNIHELIDYGKNIFGNNFTCYTEDYKHSNNRNSFSKEVLEYLLVFTPST